ncbi:MAG: response regulator [Betaproteobacteria bacterium]|nr:MAG: response regulator [Betaproteobacteria bacterium]
MMQNVGTGGEDSAARRLERVRLAGFSSRDAELFKLFLRRPPGSGISLLVVDDDPSDILIANLQTPGISELVAARNHPSTTIGIVSRYTSDAPYYQIVQDGQLLYSLAQALNRIREGWEPPDAPPAKELVSATDSQPVAAADQGASSAQFDAQVPSAADEPVPAHAHLEVTLAAGPDADAAAKTEASPTTNLGTLPWQRGLRILVVDDSNFSRAAIAEALAKVGFQVDTAVDGEDGLRMAQLSRYDIGVIDFEMPGMRGPEVIRKMRGLGRFAPQVLIMLTSRTGAVDRLRARVAGCDAYLTKPTKMSEFIALLTQFANAGKLTRQ